MPDWEDRRERRRYRSASSDEARGARRRDVEHESRRKRSRSRSEDRPRKRRSVTPDDQYADSHSRRPADRSERRRSKSPRGHDRGGDRDRRRRSRSHEGRNGHGDRPHPRDRDRDHDRRSRRPASRSPPLRFERSQRPLPSQNDAFHDTQDPDAQLESDYYKDKDGNLQKKDKPNWAPTGRLAAAANTIKTANKSIVLKYHEPAEARKPPAAQAWRMYVFKGDEILETVELGMQSCWLFGREAAVCDVLLEHASCSKQHAVLQWRYREERGEWGERKGRVRGYVLDLESANGTTVNGEDVGKARYYEVRSGDVVRFGHSEREYVVQLPPKEEVKEGGDG